MEECKKATLKHDNEVFEDRTFLQGISISIFGIILCMISLCSASWAWFNASLSSSSNTIKAAICDVTISVTCEGTKIDCTNGEFSFEDGKEYLVSISAEGTAKNSYCIIAVDEKEYFTEQIYTAPPDNTISFALSFDTQKRVEIISRWGISSRQEREIYNGKKYFNMAEQDQKDATVEENEQATTN